MPKPPTTPPHSDLTGVTRDGTRASQPLPTDQAGEALADAGEEAKARPDYSSDVTKEESRDDRTR